MKTEITFREVYEYLKKDSGGLISSVDSIFGLIIILSSFYLGPEAMPFLGLLTTKNELTKIGGRLFNFMNGKKEDDYYERYEKMINAHALICITAYYEALTAAIPNSLIKSITEANKANKFSISDALKKVMKKTQEKTDPLSESETLFDTPIAMPHPVEQFDDHKSRLLKIYIRMTDHFTEYIIANRSRMRFDDSAMTKIQDNIREVAENALQRYMAQYIELSKKYDDFAIWANFHEHEKTRNENRSDLSRYQAQLKSDIEVGLMRTQEYIQAIPEMIEKHRVENIVELLKNHNQDEVNDLIIKEEEKERNTDDTSRLKFPKI
ncbi:MAG: hypothetical protein L7F77_15005 [Candidatus Magnetominusculus sp. LBB02]|nr:hypothetical protein [Candidatus Magnetominusculus sp. LBB02]